MGLPHHAERNSIMPLPSFPSVPANQPATQAVVVEPATEKASSGPRRGVTAMEYLFVVSLIIVVAFSAVSYFGSQTKAVTEEASNAIGKAEGQQGP
jgi:hypothetical protein